MVNNLTFEELKNDKTFIDGLRNEDFVLILGAGFSYGVKNKSHHADFDTIPLGFNFLKLTNTKFDSEIDKYRIAAGKWKSAYEETKDEKLLEEFRNLFLADEKAFNYTSFERVFLPNWFKIYTLNFDNVLDLAQKNLSRKYPIFAYPNDVSNTKNSISHLHGKIDNDFQFDNIVFSPSDYIESAKAKHNLYDPFHGDVHTFKKNIVIIGTQFDEEAVLSYFFDGLQNQDIAIYHFELKNNNARELPEINKHNYNFIQLTKGVSEVFDFFEENRHKIQQYELEGAKIIDKDFIEALEAKIFLPKDFYVSKLSDDCQWYGCLHGWGIKRELYNDLKETVTSSFDQERTSTVSAVVHGAGGCGKSTQLRILALELFNEKFKTVWLENFESFNENDIAIIEKNSQQNFLIIIEDWYRFYGMYGNTVIETFNKLVALSNVRLVIGDRTLKKIYTNKLFNAEQSKFEIFPAENKDIIKKIAVKVSEWQATCEAIYENDKIKNTSLFSVLFIIADIYNKNLPAKEIRFIDIKGHFADIVKSDIKKIANKYPGLAKAMVYFANIYKEYKIRITRDAFLTVAKHFNPTANFVLLDINSLDYEEDRLISNYISRIEADSRIEWVNELDFIQYNHDTLAEDGLSKSILESWNSFGDQIELQIVDALVNSEDEATISAYLFFLLKDATSFFKNREKLKLHYIEKLYNRRIRSFAYLQGLLHVQSEYEANVKCKYAIDLLNRFIDKEYIPSATISMSLEILKNEDVGSDFAVAILNMFIDGKHISHDVVNNCLTILKKTKERETYAISILNAYQKNKSISKEIISSCLGILEESPDGITHAISILNDYQNGEFIGYQIISNCLTILKETTKGETYAVLILDKFLDGENVSNEIICSCLTILGKEEGKKYAVSILNDCKGDEFFEYQYISNCLTILKEEQEGQDFAIIILNMFFDRKNISQAHDTISNCLTILKNEPEGKEFATKILNKYKIKDKTISLINLGKCISILREDKAGLVHAKEVLDNWRQFKIFQTIYHSLSNYVFFKKDHSCIAEIIHDFKTRKNIKGVYYRYFYLFKLPFFYNKIWLSEAKSIVKNWRKSKKDLVSNVLYASQNKPEFSIKTCKQILERLEKELNIQSKREEVKIGYILNALKNPLLDTMYVKLKIKQIQLYQEENNILSDSQIKVLNEILEERN